LIPTKTVAVTSIALGHKILQMGRMDLQIANARRGSLTAPLFSSVLRCILRVRALILIKLTLD
jgi:hypothetical protein